MKVVSYPLPHLTSPSLFSSILLKSSLALPRLELSVPIISYTADTTLNNIGMEWARAIYL